MDEEVKRSIYNIESSVTKHLEEMERDTRSIKGWVTFMGIVTAIGIVFGVIGFLVGLGAAATAY